MSLGEEETRTPHTHTPSHSRRRAALALKGKPRRPARDPAGPEPRNAEFPGPEGAGVSRSAAAAREAYRALRSLFKRESGRRLASPRLPRFSTQLEPGQPGSSGREGRGTGALTSVAPHAAGSGRCFRWQVARLDGALLARGDSGVTVRPRARADGARPRAAGGAPRAREAGSRQVDFPLLGRASW